MKTKEEEIAVLSNMFLLIDKFTQPITSLKYKENSNSKEYSIFVIY
jgi:hypothetical protein